MRYVLCYEELVSFEISPEKTLMKYRRTMEKQRGMTVLMHINLFTLPMFIFIADHPVTLKWNIPMESCLNKTMLYQPHRNNNNAADDMSP